MEYFITLEPIIGAKSQKIYAPKGAKVCLVSTSDTMAICEYKNERFPVKISKLLKLK